MNVKNTFSHQLLNLNDMWMFILLIELFGVVPSPCTEQVSDMLIIRNDTLYVNIVFHQDSSIINFIDQEKMQDVDFEHDICGISYCYDEYYVVWTIQERIIYLKEIISCCSDESLDMIGLFGDRYFPDRGIKGSFVNEEMTVWNMPPTISNDFFSDDLRSIDVTVKEGIISGEEMGKLFQFED